MKKIMFNDKYGLTQAVIDGRKTQTRRIAYQGPSHSWSKDCGICTEGRNKGKYLLKSEYGLVLEISHYRIGEVLAVAQRYSDIPLDSSTRALLYNHPGWDNKMFVKAKLMPHQIKITNIRAERLKYISEEDCLKEGIWKWSHEGFNDSFAYDATDKSDVEKWWFPTPFLAYSFLINKLYGPDTWSRSPVVFVYDFELVK